MKGKTYKILVSLVMTHGLEKVASTKKQEAELLNRKLKEKYLDFLRRSDKVKNEVILW